MVGNKKTAQLIQMIEKVQTQMEESNKKMEMMGTMLENLTEESLAEISKHSQVETGNDDGK